MPGTATGDYLIKACWPSSETSSSWIKRSSFCCTVQPSGSDLFDAMLLFDRMHFKTGNTRFCNKGLLDEQDIGRLRRIWSACQEN